LEQHKRTGTWNATRHGKKQGAAIAAVEPVELEPYEHDAAQVFEEIMASGSPWLARTDAVRLAMLRQSLLRDLNKEISEWLSLLGFDPTSRARLGLAEVKAASTLEKLQAKRNN